MKSWSAAPLTGGADCTSASRQPQLERAKPEIVAAEFLRN